jgi:hypothetical protein
MCEEDLGVLGIADAVEVDGLGYSVVLSSGRALRRVYIFTVPSIHL